MLPVLLVLTSAGCASFPLVDFADQTPLPAPFQLSSTEQSHLDQILKTREEKNTDLRAFSCEFTRFDYDPIFGDADRPKYIDQGTLAYVAPDKKLDFWIDGDRAEHWIWNGSRLYEFNYTKKQLIERPFPPEAQQKCRTLLSGLLLAFVTEAEELRKLYFTRITTPPGVKDQVWIEAYPRTKGAAACFQRAEVILTLPEMQPVALKVHNPNGHGRVVYRVDEMRRNPPDLFDIQQDPFHPTNPLGWQRVVEETLSVH